MKFCGEVEDLMQNAGKIKFCGSGPPGGRVGQKTQKKFLGAKFFLYIGNIVKYHVNVKIFYFGPSQEVEGLGSNPVD